MEKVSMFSGLSFANKGVKVGTKVTNSTRPEVSRDYTKDKFTLNDKARRALEVICGGENASRVVIIDMETPREFAEGQFARFFIHKGVEYNNSISGNKIGADGGFSSSMAWSSMLLNKDNECGCKPEELVRLGLAEINSVEESGKDYLVATSKTAYGLVSCGEASVIEDDKGNSLASAEIFALVEPVVTERTK